MKVDEKDDFIESNLRIRVENFIAADLTDCSG
jgi:hypothetical protein